MPKQITQEYLKSILEYDQDTGLFLWKKRDDVPNRWNTRYAGKRLGFCCNGYWETKINDKSYRLHTLAWLFVFGEWVYGIDHINGDGTDNRICNLRKANKSENSCNSKIRKDNTSGFKGVTKRRNKWVAQIHYNGTHKYLGIFDRAEDAAKAYEQAAKRTFGTYARFS